MIKKLFKKFLCLTLASSFVLSINASLNKTLPSPIEVTAITQTSPLDDNEFHYVAIGDSVTAGYAIDDSEQPSNTWYQMTVTNNYKNSPKESYPAVVAQMIKNRLTENGYFDDGKHTFDWSNLGAPGFMTSDYVATMHDPDYIAYMWSSMDMSWGDLKAHKPYVSEITKADLITLHMGSNDLLIYELFNFYGKFAQNKLGTMFTEALRKVIMADGTIDSAISTFIDGAKAYFASTDNDVIVKDVDQLLEALSPVNFQQALIADTEKVIPVYEQFIKEIRALNPYAQLVFVGYYAPYGNSYECDGITYSLPSMIKQIVEYIAENASYTGNVSGEALSTRIDAIFKSINNAIDKLFDFLNNSINDTFDQINSVVDNFDKILDYIGNTYAIELEEDVSPLTTSDYMSILGSVARMLKGVLQLNKDFLGTHSDYVDLVRNTLSPLNLATVLAKYSFLPNEKQTEIINGIVSMLTYPLTYASIGTITQPAIQALNQKLEAKADEYNVPFVYIYDIPNENNLNPHPLTAGHKYIADKIFEKIELDPQNNITVKGSGYVDCSEKVLLGNNVQFKACPGLHGALLSVKVDGKSVEHENGVFTVNSFNYNTTIEVTFTEHSETWYSTRNEHWKECSCGKITYVGTHTYDEGVITQKPSYFNAGTIRYTCTECGYINDVKIEKLSVLQMINNVIAIIKSFLPR